MPNAHVWVETSDRTTLLRDDRVVEVVDGRTSLAVRTEDRPETLHQIVDELPQSQRADNGMLGRVFREMGAEAMRLLHQGNHSVILAALTDGPALRWTVEPSRAGIDIELTRTVPWGLRVRTADAL